MERTDLHESVFHWFLEIGDKSTNYRYSCSQPSLFFNHLERITHTIFAYINYLVLLNITFLAYYCITEWQSLVWLCTRIVSGPVTEPSPNRLTRSTKMWALLRGTIFLFLLKTFLLYWRTGGILCAFRFWCKQNNCFLRFSKKNWSQY